MQSQLIDRKLSIIYDRYKDRDFANNAQKEVEDIRKKALLIGAVGSGAAFFINEAARLTMRSPIFKLKAHNALFWLVAPTLTAKYYYDCHIHERIDNLWKVHCNRVDKGLPGTYRENGIYDDKMQDAVLQINNGTQIRFDSIIHGIVEKPYLDNPFQRFHESIEQYPDFLDDIDDVSMLEYDNFERLKPFNPKEGTTVGDTNIYPPEDNDQKLYFYDVQGESVYTNPPDSNTPFIDHGLDEENIWAFMLTGYNQQVIKNSYAKGAFNATQKMHQPMWGQKLFTPTFYKEEKLPMFFKQWGMRLQLEVIKLRQTMQLKQGDAHQRQEMKEEIENFLLWANQQVADDQLEDLYITNHEPKQKKYLTISEQEDQVFYRYKQAVEDYNSKKGSLSQDEEKMVKELERLQDLNKSILEATSEEAADEMRKKMLQEMEVLTPFTLDEFNDILDKELSVFKEGQKYSYVKDLKEAFSSGLQKTAAEKIFDTIPEHVFWDIKTPQTGEENKIMNNYNPFRKYHTTSFFDAREYEEYMDRRTKKQNLVDGVSTYRRY